MQAPEGPAVTQGPALCQAMAIQSSVIITATGKLGNIVSSSWVRKLRHREANQFAQSDLGNSSVKIQIRMCPL